MPRPTFALLALLLSLLPLVGCGGGTAPAVVPGAPPEVPVVFVPGVTGSKMEDPASGHVAWGNARALFTPRDGAYELALPIGADRADGGGDRLVAYEVLDAVRIGPIEKPVYGPFLESLAATGRRRGDLRAPRAGDTLFGFAYDWRRSNAASAAVLVERLESLRRVRGEERLTVDLVCQSNGVHVCRYLVRHGGASLDEAEAQAENRSGSAAGPPDWLHVRHLVLVAGSNGGSLRILREIDRGRTYVPFVGRRMLPEVLFTFRSLYEDLPHDPPDRIRSRFVDPDGRPLDVDLYDPESWLRYGWSVFGPDVARRIERAGRPDLFATPEQRLDFLTRALGAARRFQRLLAADPPPGRTPCYHLVGDAYVPTAQRAVLEPAPEGWRTLFTGDRRLRRGSYAYDLATAPGDLHATLSSQLSLSPAERERLVGRPFLLAGGHFELILDPASHRRVAEVLATPGCGGEVARRLRPD